MPMYDPLSTVYCVFFSFDVLLDVLLVVRVVSCAQMKATTVGQLVL